ncbi:hypothetical protein J4210_00360 [Candidatus Woesearchaeota archaeon]|nr:hypothetical protein [Candidatus Woesearchaeota archaeon]
MIGKVSKRKLQAIGSTEFPDAWISFVREFRRFKKAYSPGGKGVRDYRPDNKIGISDSNRTVDYHFMVNVSKLGQLLRILQASYLKVLGKKGYSQQKARDLVSLKVKLNEIETNYNQLPETISSVRSPAVISLIVGKMEEAIKASAGLIDFIHSNTEAEKKDKR